ncbi:hypothetical protein APHAL10511_006578 [Amanita phalloides]|nr:hypothetical protein APHAL10511_006578 [Amanita phalloides]
MPDSAPLRALEFYSGIGGLHLALKRSNVNATVVQAFDWDQLACQVYLLNHGPNIVSKVDISTLTPESLASFHADLWLLSPACQPYTVLNPNAKGASDPRAQSFLHLVQEVLPRMKAAGRCPSYIFIENVAGFEASTTRSVLRSTLSSLDYRTLELLITPIQFHIPNSRLRYYLLAKRQPLRFENDPDGGKLWRCIPRRCDTVDEEASMHIYELRRYLDDQIDEQQYRIPDRVLRKWGRLFDIVLPSERRTCCFTRGYTQLVERAGSILQMNEELDTTTVFEEFLIAQKAGDEGDDTVQILHPLRLRYFTPTELLRLFDFEKPECETQFRWPAEMTLKTKYRMIGNSVNIRVVMELLNYMFR